MNKQKYKNRIENLRTDSDLNDLKIDLSKYRSIRERVNSKTLVIKGIYVGNSGFDNISEIKKTLNQIIDDYSIFSEISSRINVTFKQLSKLLPLISAKPKL